MDLCVLPTSSTLLITATLAAVYLLYRLALPKPLFGIPYNTSSARSLLGDIPAITSHIARTDGTLITFFTSTIRSLNAPLVQVFIKPLEKPVLVLSDFREAHSLLMHRKEFDRSPALGDLLTGLVPDHHIHLKTGAKWKAQRQLVQDLMMPSYLNDVAGPVIYQKMVHTLELWRIKSDIADGRPWAAAADARLMSLDAMMAFAFGSGLEHDATRPTLEAIKGLQRDPRAVGMRSKHGESLNEPVLFPEGQVDGVLQAMLDLAATVMELHGSLAPSLKWAYLNRKPRIRRAKKTKDEYITQQLRDGVQRLDRATENPSPVTCAVDQMILREKSLAEKDGREPRLFSRVMMDELFGIVFAGNETTATTICWALKFLAEHSNAQTKLRNALQSSLFAASAEGRDPTIQEITHTRIPYLDATMEEVLRRAGTSPFVDRQAKANTQLLGHRIPRGTIVLCLLSGPSMWSPGFDIDKKRRYAAGERAAKTGGRGDKTWGPENMSAFQPERWLVPGEQGDDDLQFDPTAGPQLAFGLGPRGCFGRRLVYLELRILLVMMLWRFELLPCPATLSDYKSVLRATNEPRQCYLRLREIKSGQNGAID